MTFKATIVFAKCFGFEYCKQILLNKRHYARLLTILNVNHRTHITCTVTEARAHFTPNIVHRTSYREYIIYTQIFWHLVHIQSSSCWGEKHRCYFSIRSSYLFKLRSTVASYKWDPENKRKNQQTTKLDKRKAKKKKLLGKSIEWNWKPKA